MADRKSKMDKGTIGKRPCEISLNNALIAQADAKITNKVMKRFFALKDGLKELQFVPSMSFRKTMMLMHFKKIRDSLPNDLPKNIYTHALCCYTALYREALRSLK